MIGSFLFQPTLLILLAGMPGERISSTQIGSNEIMVTETVREGAFNPIFLVLFWGLPLVHGAAIEIVSWHGLEAF